MTKPSSDQAPALKSARTRRRILDAAAAVFREQGYAPATLKDIARRADMQAGSLYYHFESKEALVEEVFETGVAAVHETVQAALKALGKEADAITRLRVAVSTHLCCMLDESDYAAANLRLLSQIPAEIRERHLRRQRRYGTLWNDLIRDATRARLIPAALNPSIVRMLLLGALNWSVEWYHPDGESPQAIAEHLIALLLAGSTPQD